MLQLLLAAGDALWTSFVHVVGNLGIAELDVGLGSVAVPVAITNMDIASLNASCLKFELPNDTTDVNELVALLARPLRAVLPPSATLEQLRMLAVVKEPCGGIDDMCYCGSYSLQGCCARGFLWQLQAVRRG